MVDGATTVEPSRERIPHLFDLGAKVISLSIALTYLVGFLVAAWHLSKYGVSSLSLLHLQYLVAGLWVVLPPSFVALMMRTKELPIIHMDQRTPKLHWLVRFAVNLVTSLPFSIVFALFVGFVVIGQTLWSDSHVWGGLLTGANSAGARLVQKLQKQIGK